jgi:adenylate cyclase
MFSDIRGFTTIAEGLDAHGLTNFLNRYLTPMTAVILEHQGTVDKYMADGIMAFWNAPLDLWIRIGRR